MPSRRAPNCATAPPLQKLGLRLSRFHRDALPTAPRPHRYKNLACDFPGFTGTRSQLRHGPTATKTWPATFPVSPGRAPNCATAPPLQKLGLRLSRFHRDALPTAPRPHRNGLLPVYHNLFPLAATDHLLAFDKFLSPHHLLL